MDYSSIPVYLEPHNWQQQQNYQQGSCGGENPLPPPPPQAGGVGSGSIRPGSMVDRARLAKVPQPEHGLNCPRCQSSNTKFCYFNNYSLSQPRHFCKTCRRYWTRGGALRNVPVGGGCRRNKRSKNSSSKSGNQPQMDPNSTTSTIPSSCCTHMTEHLTEQQLSLTPSLPNVTQYDISTGANFGQSSSSGMEFQHFPFLATGFEQPAGLFPFQNEGILGRTSSGVTDQLADEAPLKTEETKGMNLSRPFLGISENANQYWGGNAWTTDLSATLNSSSTSNFLF